MQQRTSLSSTGSTCSTYNRSFSSLHQLASGNQLRKVFPTRIRSKRHVHTLALHAGKGRDQRTRTQKMLIYSLCHLGRSEKPAHLTNWNAVYALWTRVRIIMLVHLSSCHLGRLILVQTSLLSTCAHTNHHPCEESYGTANL